MELTVTSPVNGNSLMHLMPRNMNVDQLDEYFAENEDYVINWMGFQNVAMIVDGEGIQNVIYVGTAGKFDHFWNPKGSCWLRAPRGTGEAQIMGHAMLTRRAENGIKYAVNWE